jgi:cytochrome c peroxidase
MKRVAVAALITVSSAFVGGILLPNIGLGEVEVGPVPPPPIPPNVVPLTPVEQLGKYMLYDHTLSDPPGYACATCHVPETGFTGPNSEINLFSGPMPGVVPGRFRNRKPYSYGYAAFSPEGPYFDTNVQVWVGGQLWDGLHTDLAAQAQGPPLNPNEMDNTPAGTAPHQYSPLLAAKLAKRPYTPLFKQVYGKNAFKIFTPQQIYLLFAEGVAAFESSPEILQFSSKFDAALAGKYTMTASELSGMNLYFGQAQCSQCHSSANFPALQLTTQGRDVFTMFCFANIGIPKNPNNPYYQETDPTTNPTGYNPLGRNYIDYGLGGNANGALDGTKFFNNTPGDIPQFAGLFLTPSLRNTDQRPSPDFVKAYMHNGVLKSLKEVVHFYNTRNLTTHPGEAIDFTQANPYANLVGTPLWPTPEVPNPVSLTNPTGAPPLAPGVAPPPNTNGYGQIGNLGLTDQQENDVVAFLATLSDGFTKPNPLYP